MSIAPPVSPGIAPEVVDRSRRSRRRRAGGWIAIVAALIVVGVVGAVVSDLGQWSRRDALDPESAGPDGARALAQVLTERGVHVEVVRDREAAVAAARASDATLFLPDSPYLSDDSFTALAQAANDVVVAQPRSRGVRLLFPGSRVSGFGDSSRATPACDLPAAERSGAVVVGTVFSSDGADAACYPADGGFGLLQRIDGGRRTTIVDGTDLFTNQNLAENGNAALGVNLLGRLPVLVWYVPSLADSDTGAAAPTLGELTPAWVSPVIVLLLVAGAAAGVWRGRRFGPLVSETLPVTVRAAETTQGRARLYARARDTVHAADRLRIGTLTRLARLLGLGPAATADEIADAAADRVAAPHGEIRGILIESTPASDRELVALSDRLRDLEAAVRAAVRSTGGPPADSGRNRP